MHLINVSGQTVNAIENGKYDPSLPLAFRIAELFDRPIEAIFVPDSRALERKRSHLPAFKWSRSASKA